MSEDSEPFQYRDDESASQEEMIAKWEKLLPQTTCFLDRVALENNISAGKRMLRGRRARKDKNPNW